MKKYILLALILTGCSNNMFCVNPEDITNMYSSYVNEWQEKAKTSFDKAEAEVFVIKPKPDDVVGPNPDVSKCVCKGAGIIVQGDGHKTPCPFHHKGDIPSQKLPVRK
jgi:hypothetical protein